MNCKGAGPGLQPVAGHITTAVRLAPCRSVSGRRRVAVVMAAHNRLGRARTKSKRSRKSRQWKLPASIHSPSVSFRIDQEIRAARLQSRWQLVEAIAFGRRCLEVAIEDAGIYEGYSPGEYLAYWTRVAELADRAHSALDRLIRHIGPKGVPPSDILVRMDRVPLTWTKSGKIRIHLHPPGQPLDQAKNDTDGLLAARDALAGFANRSRQRRKSLAERRKNEGDVGKQTFVYRLAEGWIFLTGKPPGRNFDSSRNPFLRFVIAAWTDAGFGNAEEDFSRALDGTLKRFAAYEGWGSSKQSRQTVSGLAEHGPVWFIGALRSPSEEAPRVRNAGPA
jgi:hypothetical protein